MERKHKEETLRKCVGCNEMRDKKQLIRIVRGKDGEIKVDEKGKASGRGVYICRKRECFENASKRKRLEASLKARIPEEIIEVLEEMVDRE
ncbi:MAG: YlxR family protein [Lachnospiraceae bacterium]|nr:YlxR family protein [Lachnospiraceae bacterium]